MIDSTKIILVSLTVFVVFAAWLMMARVGSSLAILGTVALLAVLGFFAFTSRFKKAGKKQTILIGIFFGIAMILLLLFFIVGPMQ